MKRGWKARGGNGRVNKAKCTRSDTWPRVGNRGIFLSTPFHAIVLSTFFQPFSYLSFFFFLFAPPPLSQPSAQRNNSVPRAFCFENSTSHANFSTVQSSFVRSFSRLDVSTGFFPFRHLIFRSSTFYDSEKLCSRYLDAKRIFSLHQTRIFQILHHYYS